MYGCRVLQATLGVASVAFFVAPAWGQCQVSEVAKLTASDAAFRDNFGVVSISGDTAVIGAGNQGNPGNNLGFGKAYVFEFDGADWGQVAELTPSDPQVDHEFSNAVAISIDAKGPRRNNCIKSSLPSWSNGVVPITVEVITM